MGIYQRIAQSKWGFNLFAIITLLTSSGGNAGLIKYLVDEILKLGTSSQSECLLYHKIN